MNEPRVDVLVRYVRQFQANGGGAETDRELLHRYAVQRDEAAFAAVVSRHGPLVWNVCRRALNHQDAEDVFQATFLVLARKAGTVHWQDQVASWLHAVATRLARKARAEKRDLPNRANPTPSQAGPLEEMSARELLTALDEELATLPEKERAPLVLCLLQGQTQEEAARLLGISLSSVRRGIDRARKRLRLRLMRRGLSLAAACGAILAHSAVVAAPPPLAEAGTLSPRAAALAQTLLAGPSKLRWTAAILLLLGAVAAGIGLAAAPPRAALPTGPEKQVAASGPAGRHARPPEQEPLPPGARARLGTRAFRQGAWINTLAYSPDGRLLATGGEDRAICLWDAGTGRRLHRLVGHRRSCQKVVFSPDGKLLASLGGEEPTIVLWDVATGKEVRRLPGHQRQTNTVAFSADSRALASTGLDGGLLWDVPGGKLIRRLPGKQTTISCVAYAPFGRMLAVGGTDGSVRLCDEAGMQSRRLIASGNAVSILTFSGDGRRLAVGRGPGPRAWTGPLGSVEVWDVQTGKRLHAWSSDRGYVSSVEFSPDGKLLAFNSYVSYDFRGKPSARLYDLATGRPAVRLEENWGTMNGVAFSPNGKVLAAADTNAVRRWDVATGRELPPRSAHRGPVWSVAVSPDGKTIYSAGGDAVVRGWDAATGKELFRLDGHASQLMSVRLSPDGKLLASSDGSLVQLWDAASRKPLNKIEVSPGALRMLAFTPDGRSLLTASDNHSLCLWAPDTAREQRRVPMAGRSSWLAFTPDGGTIATAATIDGWARLRLLDARTGRATLGSKGVIPIAAVAVSPDGRWLASGQDGGNNLVELHTLPDLKPVRKFAGHTGGVQEIAFAPDGWTLASASRDGTVRLWETITGQERRRLLGHEGEVHALAFSADGRLLVSGGQDTSVLVWDLHEPLPGDRRGKPPTRAQIEQHWADLAGAAGPRAYEAVLLLAAFPEQSVPLLSGQLKKVLPTPGRIAQLIGDLDSDDYQVRERASDELRKLGRLVEPDLTEALARTRSLEVRHRLKDLCRALKTATNPPAQAEWLRLMRMVEVLERMGTPSARLALESIARSTRRSDLTRAAAAALKRLERRRVVR